jgi:integrase
MRMTVKAIEALKPSDKRQEIPDALMRGLYFVIQPSGHRSWCVRYRYNGESRKFTIGSFPAHPLAEAREEAGRVIRAVDEGRDPQNEKQEIAQRDDIAVVAEQFMERYSRRQNRAGTVAANERMFRDYILPAWRGRNIQDIKKRDIVALIEDVAGKFPVAANRVHALLSKMFAWCANVDIIEASPMTGVARQTKERSRERVLDDAELRRIWIATAGVGTFGAVVRMLLLSGQRRDEVLRMTWDEIDLDKRVWNLPPERVKNSRAHAVPLSDEAVKIIESRPRTGKHVFPGVHRSRGKTALDRAIGEMVPWCLHDIRRTVSTNLARMGISLQVTERLLNHRGGSISGVAAVYNWHSNEAEMRTAVQALGRFVVGLAEGRPGCTILPLSRAL